MFSRYLPSVLLTSVDGGTTHEGGMVYLCLLGLLQGQVTQEPALLMNRTSPPLVGGHSQG